MAKAGRDAAAWKEYRAALRKEKEQWRGKRIVEASSNWGVYKSLTKPRKQWGEQYMAAATSADPVQDVKNHFESVFHRGGQDTDMEKLEGLLKGLGCDGQWVAFTEQETREAIMKVRGVKRSAPTEYLQKSCSLCVMTPP